MWSHKTVVYVRLLTCLALVPAMAGRSFGQDSGAATMALRATIIKSHRPTLGLSRKLPLSQVRPNPSAYNVGNDPSRRSLCAL
jgi:hypothetical protein